MEILQVILGLLAFAAVLLAGYYTSKIVAKNQMRLSSSKYMKIVDRISVGKEAGFAILRIGDKYFLASLSAGKVDIVRNLEEDELVCLPQEHNSIFEPSPFSRKIVDFIFESGKRCIAKGKKIGKQTSAQKNTSASFQDILRMRLGSLSLKQKDRSQSSGEDIVVDQLLADSLLKAQKLKDKINTDEGIDSHENE